jgi:hypothetical protein
MICDICNHDSKESEPHRPNMCKQCNCGQSEIVHSTAPPFYYSPVDWGNTVHVWGERLSHFMRPSTRTRQGGGY